VADDQQTKPPAYPNFPSTTEGLAMLHRELGRLLHLSFEHEIAAGETQQQTQKLAQAARVLTTKHAPGMCQPVPAAEDDAAPPDAIPTIAEVFGVPESAVTVVPTPSANGTVRPSSRRKGVAT
jgi:hypothetical protein